MRTWTAYFACLSARKQILWCYLIWYLVTVYYRFDASPAIWVNSMGISLVIGTGLILSVAAPVGKKADPWQIFRLFLIPFCVSSFAALIKDHGYIFVFPTDPGELLMSMAACAIFVIGVFMLRKTVGITPTT